MTQNVEFRNFAAGAARALGLNVSQNLLARADEVIERGATFGVGPPEYTVLANLDRLVRLNG